VTALGGDGRHRRNLDLVRDALIADGVRVLEIRFDGVHPGLARWHEYAIAPDNDEIRSEAFSEGLDIVRRKRPIRPLTGCTNLRDWVRGRLRRYKRNTSQKWNPTGGYVICVREFHWRSPG
jgi:hypothetical protein